MNRRRFLRSAARFWVAATGAFALSACLAESSPVSSASRLRKIGYLSGNAQSSVDLYSPPFRARLRELSYVEGRDISIVFKVADNVNVVERLAGYASELVSMPVDVLLAEAGPAQAAAMRATSTIPIVFVLSSDPVGQGLVASIARPGGNVTGVRTASYAAKQVELLKETVPNLARLAVIANATNVAVAASGLAAVEAAARGMAVTVTPFSIPSRDELDASLGRIAVQGFDALLVLPALSLVRTNDQIPEFANKIGLPQVYSDAVFARAGGLFHYGANFAAQHRRAAEYVDKIFRGAHPADLPVDQPTDVDLIVNLDAAKKLGLKIPETVMRRATEIIGR